MTHAPPPSGGPDAKHLTLRVGQTGLAIPIGDVREIISHVDITRVPNSWDCLEGVINLRGKVVPVLDLGRVLGIEPDAENTRRCIVIVQLDSESGDSRSGLVVDSVSEVLSIPADAIEPPPTSTAASVTGLARTPAGLVLLLSIGRVLAHDDALPV